MNIDSRYSVTTRSAGVQPQQSTPMPVCQTTPQYDSAEISDFARRIAESGIFFFPSQKNGAISFSLDFSASASETLSLQGTFRQEHHLSLHIQYEQWDILPDGTVGSSGIRYTLDIDASSAKTIATSSSVKKEDILLFVQKLIRKLQDLSKKSDTLIAGILFRDDDLRELAELEKGKILKLLYEFIGAINTLVRMKQMSEQFSPDAVFLHPERTAWKEETRTEERSSEFSFSVRTERIERTPEEAKNS